MTLLKHQVYSFCLQMTQTCFTYKQIFNMLIEEAKVELNKASAWFHCNKLSLNINKTNFKMFTPENKKCNKQVAVLNINGITINQVKSTKLLGIYTKEHLNWSLHIDNVVSKIAPTVGVLYKLQQFLLVY